MNYFNPKIQLKNTEPTITIKQKDLVSELRGFKFMTILVIELKKKVESDDARKYSIHLVSTRKQKQLLIRVILMMYLN